MSGDIDVAQGSILLSKVPDDVFNAIFERSSTVAFDRGSTIFIQGENAHSIFLVLDGWAKLYRITHNGAEAVVGVFTKSGTFGEAVAFRGDVYPVTAEAVTDCRLLQIDTQILLTMMHSKPELCHAILAATFQHLHELVHQVEQLKARSGAQRLAEFLIELCPCDDGACTVTLPYDKVLIAGRLGMKPESLSRAFARLKSAGVTVRQNHAAIKDVKNLLAFAEEDRAAAWTNRQ